MNIAVGVSSGELRTGTGLPAESWFSADDLAALKLPGLPRSKRHINDRAREEQWALKVAEDGTALVRRRKGVGGGLEYHFSVLPAAARLALARDLGDDASSVPANDATPAWQWFDLQTDKVKEAGRERLDIVVAVHELEAAGFTRSAAIGEIEAERGISKSTLWSYLRLVSGLAPSDWLPALAPQRKGGGAEAEIDGDIWQVFKSDYLRPEKPTYSSCYRRAQRVAEARGITIPTMKTFQRKLEREVPANVLILRRDGSEALRRSMPAQRRSVAQLHAMELVNIDGHKFDVFVRDGDQVFRPMMVAIQDIMSRKVLAWRFGESESAILTRLAFADLFRNFGIPKGCLLDNGRAFASKWITGGALTRFRFKIRKEDPTGLLPALGINPHWATPYRGQSKPIERAFRDFCQDIAKHPAFAGAYTGNRPDAKPENYGSHAVPLADFVRIVGEEIAHHNARLGRRTEMAHGGSFDATFQDSYARAPVGRATEEQLRLALLAGENRRVDRQTGAIEMLGNRYWSPELLGHYGQLVTVRFDPDDLHQAVHVYDLSGRHLCAAEPQEMTGFQDVAAAKVRSKQEAAWRKSARDGVAAEHLLAASEIAAMLPKPAAPEPMTPAVTRIVRHRGQQAAALKVVRSAQPQNDEFLDDFMAGVTKLRAVE